MLDPRCELPLAEPVAGAVRVATVLVALAGLAAATVAGAQTGAPAETLVGPPDLAEKIKVENVTEGGGVVSGELVNNTDRALHEVKLRVEYYWLWRDEHHQGTNDPSFSVTEALPEEVLPHARMPFSYTFPAARTERQDGRWLVSVRVLGYSLVTKIIERTLVQ